MYVFTEAYMYIYLGMGVGGWIIEIISEMNKVFIYGPNLVLSCLFWMRVEVICMW